MSLRLVKSACVCSYVGAGMVVMFMHVWVTRMRGDLERAGGRKFILWLLNTEDKLRKCCANVKGSAANARTHMHTGFYHLGGLLSLSQPSSHEATQPLGSLPNKPTPSLSASCLCVQHLCDTLKSHGCVLILSTILLCHIRCHDFNILLLRERCLFTLPLEF